VDPNLLRDPGEGAYAGSWGGALDTAQADDIAYSIFRNQAGPDHDTIGGYPDRGYTMGKPNPNPVLFMKPSMLAGWSGGSYTGGTVVDPNLLRDPGEGAYAGSWGGALDTAQADDIAYSIFRNQAGPDHDTVGGYPDRGYTMSKPNPNPQLLERVVFLKNPSASTPKSLKAAKKSKLAKAKTTSKKSKMPKQSKLARKQSLGATGANPPVVDPEALRDPGEGSFNGHWGGALEHAQESDVLNSIWRNVPGPTDTIGGYPNRGFTLANPNPQPNMP